MSYRNLSNHKWAAVLCIFLLCFGLSPVLSATFSTVVVDNAANDVGRHSSIALDSNGEPHISYYDATNDDLKCADMNSDSWNIQVVEATGDVGQYSSLAIDMLNNRYISYYYATNNFLRLAYTQAAAGPWDISPGPSVIFGPDRSTSIVLEHMAINPIIAVFDDNDRNLKLAMFDRADLLPSQYKDANGWATEIITSSSFSMQAVSIALDNANEPHLAYIELTGPTANLMYCEKACAGAGCLTTYDATQPTGVGTWFFETVDGSGSVGNSASLCLDANDIPHICYYDASTADLKYATKAGANWTIETADNSTNVGQYCSIKVDAANNPHISYYDAASGDLKYATKAGGAWSVQTVDAIGNVGQYTSMALDADNNPHISYYDVTNGNLKYASLQRERICFPFHRGVPGNTAPPIIDGIVQEDVGWRGAYRMTHGNGADPAHMAFQALRHKTDPYLYLSFEVRNDQTFDDNDIIVICFRPNANGGAAADDRRLFIYPLCDEYGAAGPACDLNVPDDKVDRVPRLVEVWENSASWSSTPQPGGLDVKVRSYNDGSSLAWNLEVRIPTSRTNGGPQWVDFTDEFLFYFDVIRVLGPVASEFRWPRSAPEVNGDIYAYDFSPSEWGEGSRNNAEVCKGVWLEYMDVGTTNDPASQIKYTTPAPNTFTNLFFANIKNNSESNGVTQPAEDISVRFRLANWGIPGPDDWSDILLANPPCPNAGLQNNPTCTKDIPAATSDVIPGIETFNIEWKVPDNSIADYRQHSHQCILVEVDSRSNTNIVTKSVYRNMDFVTASAFTRSAEISANGYESPPGGGSKHDFLLNVTTRETENDGVAHDIEYMDRKSPVSSLRWTAHGYHYEGRSIIIHDTMYDIVDPVGSFGYFVKHDGIVKDWNYWITGAEPEPGVDDLYRLEVLPNASSSIVTTIIPREYRLLLSLHGGYAIPTGNFANAFDPGVNLIFDLEYLLSPKFSLVTFVGYNNFKSKTAGVDDSYLINISANMRYLFAKRGSFSFLIGGGPGIYMPESGDDWFDANVGLYANYDVGRRLVMESGADYHSIFDSDGQFLHIHAGMLIRIW